MHGLRGLFSLVAGMLLLGLALPAHADITDADADNMDDAWEQANGLNASVYDAGDDLDSDTFSNLAEYRLGSNPQEATSLPPLLGNYSESFEAAPPAFWFSPGNPSSYAFDWVWDNTTSTDGVASLRATQGPTDWSAANDVTIAIIVNVADSFMNLDYKLLTDGNRNCGPFGCGSYYALGNFEIRVDGTPAYTDNTVGATGNWIDVDSLFLPAGEHLIEFVFDGIRTDSGVGFNPSSYINADSVWIDALEIVEANSADTTDTDGDGLTDYDEVIIHGTNNRSWDTDDDGIGDAYELANQLDPLVDDASLDPDADGFTNLFEYRSGTLIDDPVSIPPLVNSYVEEFAGLVSGELPTGWFIPGIAQSRQGAEPELADSLWYAQLPNAKYPSLTGGAALGATNGPAGKLEYLELQLNVLESTLVINTFGPTCGYSLRLDGTVLFTGFFDSRFYALGNSALLQRVYLPAGSHTLRFGLGRGDGVASGCVDTVIDTLTLVSGDGVDTDGDGLTDLRESLVTTTDPANPDSDGDGLNDGVEVITHGTNPKNVDTDGDGLNDGAEVTTHGTNPNLADTDGDSVSDGTEVTNGLDPLDPADVITPADWDGDRYPNVIEQLYGTSAGNAADHPLPHPFIDGRLESFETPFDTTVWSLGLWRTTTDDAIQGVRSLKPASTLSTAKVTVNARAGTRMHFRYKNLGSIFTLKINGSARTFYATANQPVMGWYQAAETFWGTAGLALATGVNVIEFTSNHSAARIDDIRFATTDSDTDGMSDDWETEHGLNPTNPADQSLDSDNDGFTALDESLRGTDPANPDTDDDGVPDGAEPSAGLNPLRPDVGADTDGDGLLDSNETLTHLTEPYIADTDLDGWSDGFEIAQGLNPLNATDNTSTADTDGDRYPNRIEVLYGTGPANAASKPPIPVYADGQQESFEPTFDAAPWDLSGGGSSWVITNAAAIDGSYSLRSTSAGTTSVVITVNARAGTNMHFRFRADDLVNRRVQVRFNGGVIAPSISGSDWKYGSALGLQAGANQIAIEYTGRAANKPAVGCDCVYIDAIEYFHYPDYDQDGMSNAWETENGLNDSNSADAALDTDGDGLTALAEYHGGSDPRTWDTDGDTLADGMDIGAGFNPRQNDLAVDNDNDGVSNAAEVRNGTDPNDAGSLPPLLGNYFESFEDASPPFWFSPGGSGPEDLDWQWTPLTATDGVASVVATTGPLETNKSPNVSMLVTAADSFMSFDYSAINNAAWPGCGVADCTLNAEFSVTVDDEPMYVINPTGVIDWTPVGGVFLPAGEHLIEFGLTSPACVGAACSNAQPDDVAQAWLDSLLIKPADPEDDTDSDGDGVTDYDEVYQYHTDPMFPDIVCEDPANPPDGKLFNEDCDTGCHP